MGSPGPRYTRPGADPHMVLGSLSRCPNFPESDADSGNSDHLRSQNGVCFPRGKGAGSDSQHPPTFARPVTYTSSREGWRVRGRLHE